MSQSSMMATAQASLLKCEASLSAMQAAFSEVRRELAEVRTALDITARSLEQDSPGTFSSSNLGRLDNPQSLLAWDQEEETSTTALEEITDGESPGLRV